MICRCASLEPLDIFAPTTGAKDRPRRLPITGSLLLVLLSQYHLFEALTAIVATKFHSTGHS